MNDSNDTKHLRAPVIASTAVSAVQLAVCAAEANGLLPRRRGWSRRLSSMIPDNEVLTQLDALARLTLEGCASAASELNRRLSGFAQQYRVPDAIARDTPQAVAIVEEHAHPEGTEAALTLWLAGTLAAASDQDTATRNRRALEGLFARTTVMRNLASLARAALVDHAALAPLIAEFEKLDGGFLGPHGGPVRFPPRELIDRRLLECLQRASAALPRLPLQPSYHLQHMDDPWACPGTRVVLTGLRFGSQPGRVVFHGSSGPLSRISVAVPAADWTDTVITVEIPPKAAAGKLSLNLPGPRTNVNICGLDFSWSAPARSDVDYRGGVGAVDELKFQLGTSFPLAAGTPITLTWRARPSNAYVVFWVRDASGTLVNDQTSSGGIGTFTWTPPLGVETTYTATVYAYHCGEWGKLARDLEVVVRHRIGIRQIEVAQVTQFLEAASKAGGGEDNSVPLVRGKPAMARVYLETNQGSALTRDEYFVDLHGSDENGPLPGSPLTATARRVLPATTALGDVANLDDDLRDQIDTSANFLLPVSWLALDAPGHRSWATINLRAEVTAYGGVELEVDAGRASVSTVARIYRCAPLKVILYRVRLFLPTGPLAPPSPAEARATLESTRHMFPCSALEILEDSELGLPLPTTTFGTVWFEWILGMLKTKAAERDDDADAIYCALLPSSTPLGQTAGLANTCPRQLGVPEARGYAVFRSSFVGDAGHEIGHACGRPHTWDDTAFPVYEDGVTHTFAEAVDGSTTQFTVSKNGLGQWGIAAERASYDDGWIAPLFRPSTGAATTTAQAAGDIMSYRHLLGHVPWPSPYTYTRLMWDFGGIGVEAVGVPTSLRFERGERTKPSTVFVSGTIAVDGAVEARAHHDEAWPHVGLRAEPLGAQELRRAIGGEEVGFWLAVLGRSGELLSASRLDALRAPSGTLAFTLATPLPPDAHRVSLRSGNREIWGVTRASPPTLDAPVVEVEGGHLSVTARASGAKLYALSVSHDEGRTWRRLRTWQENGSWRVPLDDVRRGGPIALRVLATDGELATASVDATASLERAPGSIAPMFELVNGVATIAPGRRVRLSVIALEADGSSRSPEEHDRLVWRSEPEAVVGRGRTADVCLDEGRYTLVVSAEGDDTQLRLTLEAVRTPSHTPDD